MTISEQPNRFSKFCAWLGGGFRSYLKLGKRISVWLSEKGMPRAVIECLKWTSHIVLLLLVLCSALLIVTIGILIFLAVRNFNRVNREPGEWVIGDQMKHRDSGFYDPINYSDPDDPRFDER